MEKYNTNLNAIAKIATFASDLSKLLNSLSDKTKNLPESEKEKYIKSELNSNQIFERMRNEKSFISENMKVVIEEFNKLEKIFERRDSVLSNYNSKDNFSAKDTEVVDLILINSNKKIENSNSLNNLKSNGVSGKTNGSPSNKLDKIPTIEASSIDYSKDPTAKLIDENSDYTLVKYISRGQFGRVYKAISKKDNKEYAIKTIPINGNLPCKYLLVEEKAHHTLNHLKENIIYCYEQLEINSSLRCIVLELADDSLDNFIKTNFPKGIPEQIAFFFIEQIFKGIKFIHSKNMIHRDIKPANVLIKEFKVKICDFNVCRFFDDPEPKFTCVATPGYAAPEVMRPTSDFKKEEWPKVDVYSLGILLYFLLYGKLPYEFNKSLTIGNRWEKAVKDINYNHDHHKISEEAVEFIKLCLSVKLEERPSLDNLKTTKWFKKFGSEFNAVVKSNKIMNHKHLYEILKSKY